MRHTLLALVCYGVTALAMAENSASESEAPPQPASKLTVEQVLSELLNKDAYTEQTRCVRLNKVREARALDEHHIVFRVSRSEYYLVQLKQRCPGLHPRRPLVYQHRSGSLCKMDSISTLYRDTGRPGPRCQLEKFQSITKEQLVVLKDAIAQQ